MKISLLATIISCMFLNNPTYGDINNVGTKYCFGDGTGFTCPCGNNDPNQSFGGCKNSLGIGSPLEGLGWPSISNPSLRFVSYAMPPNELALLFVGEATISNGNGYIFGDGLRCVGTKIIRIGWKQTNIWGEAVWYTNELPTGNYPGDIRYFQVWYSDNNNNSPCGWRFNLTNGVQILYTN